MTISKIAEELRPRALDVSCWICWGERDVCSHLTGRFEQLTRQGVSITVDQGWKIYEVEVLLNNLDAFQSLPSASFLWCDVNY